jgi:hypothetical protein
MLRLALICSVFAAACGSDSPKSDNDPFATYQDCYDEHHKMESFPTVMAIEICCIDHPIGSAAMNVVCGDTTQSCTSYVTQNLTDAADTMLTADINTACTAYPTDRSK